VTIEDTPAWWEAEDRIFSFWPCRDSFDVKVMLAQLKAEIDAEDH
jgi:hypothetical protein